MTKMRARAVALSVMVAAAMLGGAPAAFGAVTNVDVDLTPGTLSISAPASATATASLGDAEVVVEIGETVVSDQRGTLAGWQVVVSATDFQGVDETDVIPAEAMTWQTGDVTNKGGGGLAGVVAGPGGVLAEPAEVVSADIGSGSGEYGYTGSVAIDLSGLDLLEGTYSGTITQTVV